MGKAAINRERRKEKIKGQYTPKINFLLRPCQFCVKQICVSVIVKKFSTYYCKTFLHQLKC